MTTPCREGNGSHKEAWALWILSTSWNSWQVRTAETFPQILNSNGVMIFTDFHLASNVILMRHTKLKDDPTVRWREELVSDIILRQVPVKHQVTDKLMVESIPGGVTVHRHLRHLWPAWRVRAQEPHQPLLCPGLPCHGGQGEECVLPHIGKPFSTTFFNISFYTFVFHQVNLLRKYSSVVDVPMTFLVCPTVYLAGLAQWFQLQRAMMAHWSQVDLNATFDMEFMTIVLFSVHVVPPSIHAVLTLHFDQHSGADEQTWRAGEEGVLAQGFSWISKRTLCSQCPRWAKKGKVTWLLWLWGGDQAVLKNFGVWSTCPQKREIKKSESTVV